MATDRPVLDLLTASVARPVVRIDGVSYRLRGANDLTLEQHVELEELRPAVLALVHKVTSRKRLSPAERAQLKAGLARICAIALLAPPRVLAALMDTQQLLVMQAFFVQSTTVSRPTSTKPPAGRPSSGASSFRGSNGSTGARAGRGPASSR